MQKEPVIPPSQQSYVDDWHFSPGVWANDLLFLSGVTGTNRQTGEIPGDFESQARNAFETVQEVLGEAALSWDDVVDLTTYHIGLSDHGKSFRKIKDEYIKAPYPAWTAIGVSELATPGLVIELKVVAMRRREGKEK